MEADSGCALALKDNVLVDAISGQRFSEEAESAGAMSGFWLYRDGKRYILENENYSQAKSRRWLVFTYDSGKVVLDGAYIFSIDINPNTGPYWHGYDCRGDAKPFAVPTKEPFSDVALEALCGGAEGWVVSGKDKAVPVSAKGLAVSFPFTTPATVTVQPRTCLLKVMFRIFRSWCVCPIAPMSLKYQNASRKKQRHCRAGRMERCAPPKKTSTSAVL
jgi:hypothetical protein